MKKIISILMVIMLLSCGVAMAKSNENGNGYTSSSMIIGLDKAMIHAENQEQEQKITQIMEKVQTNTRERLNNIQELVIEETEDDGVIASGKTQAKLFGLIPMQKMLRYNIDENGEVSRHRFMFDFMFKFNGDKIV